MSDVGVPDDELVRRARAGDREALTQLLQYVHGRLGDLAVRMIGSKLRARVRVSDIVQSTCAEVIRSVPDFAGDSVPSFNAWVAQILRNNLRKKGRHFNADKRREPGAEPEAAAGSVPLPGSVSQDAAQADDLRIAAEALAMLPERMRQIIQWRLLENREYDEVARLAGTSEANARSLYSRARAALAIAARKLRGGPDV